MGYSIWTSHFVSLCGIFWKSLSQGEYVLLVDHLTGHFYMKSLQYNRCDRFYLKYCPEGVCIFNRTAKQDYPFESHTPHGRLFQNLPQGSVIFNSKNLFSNCIWNLHPLYTIIWLNIPQRGQWDKACFTREGTSTTAVYGKHIFLHNFSFAIMLEMFCFLNLTYLQKENAVKIWAINTKSFSRYKTCWVANVTFFDGHKFPFLSIKHNIRLKTIFCL